RQKMNITILDGEVTDNMKAKKWDARVSLVEESFNIKLMKPSELEK
ncbi:MAG: hypothetical protein HQL10_14090, partial [Nitrospirae bacterium]|nr:hypothetical protein [Nitrospirota bacterium]